MKTIFRTFSIFTLTLCVLGVAGFVYWTRIPGLLSYTLTQKLGTHTHVGNLYISWDKIALEQTDISSLSMNSLPSLLTAKKAVIHAPWQNYLKQEIVIDSIQIDGVTIGLDEGKWENLMTCLAQSLNPSEGRSVLIKKLILRNVKIDVLSAGQVIELKMIPYVELTDIHTTEGDPVEQITKSVIGSMIYTFETHVG